MQTEGTPITEEAPVEANPASASAPAPESHANPEPTLNSPIALENSSVPQSASGDAPAAPAAALDSSISEHLKANYGIDAAGFENPTQVIDYFAQAAYTAQQAVQENEQLRALVQSYQQPASQPTTPVTAPVVGQDTAPKPPSGWDAPEIDEQWLQLVKYNPQLGVYEAKIPGAIDPAIVSKVNARAAFDAKWQRDFQTNPRAFLDKLLQDKFSETQKSAEEAAYQRMVKHWESTQQVQQQNQSVQSIINENSSWLHQRDAAGNLLRDARGTPLMTPKGLAYAKSMQQLVASGIDPNSSEALHGLAMQLAGISTQAVDPQARAQAFAQASPNRLDQAIHSPSQNGSALPSAVGGLAPLPQGTSFWAAAQDEMRRRGIPVSPNGHVQPLV
jgi:hypothetical protein